MPVLDEVHDFHGADPQRYGRVETVSWFNNRAREGASSGGNLRATAPGRIWNTNLGRDCYNTSIDRNEYR